MVIQYNVAFGYLMHPPNNKSVAVNVSTLFMMHISHKYMCILQTDYCSLWLIPTASLTAFNPKNALLLVVSKIKFKKIC